MEGVKFDVDVKVPNLPKIADKTKIDVRYMVIDPYVSIHIYWDAQKGEVVYEVEEPIISEESKKNLEVIEKAMREMINTSIVAGKGSGEDLIAYIDKTTRLVISELGLKVEEEEYNRMFYYVYRDFIGLNEIEPLLRDYFIEDLECNGVGDPIYIIHRVYRNLKTNVRFNSIEGLASFVEKLAQKTGRYISYASPLLDGSLPDGSRVNATYTKDVTSKGPTFTIRKFTKSPWTPTQLLGFGTLSPEMMAYLWIALQYKSNLMIVGGTASGKTTLLNAISFFIPPENRVVSIEDTRELNLSRENWLPSVVRSGLSSTGVGDVDMFSLLRNSFRQAPDYVIVGEVRGKEAAVLFQGMASGHASISTMHADSVQSLVRRLETPPISLNSSLVNGLDVVAIATHAIVNGQETRKISGLVEVVNVDDNGNAEINIPFKWNPADNKFYFKKDSVLFKKINQRYGIPIEQLWKEFDIRTKILYAMFQNKIFGFNDAQRVINDYFKEPNAVLKKLGLAS